MALCYAALREIIRRKLDIDPVSHQDTDPVSTHTAGDRREDNMLAVLDLDLKKRVGLFVYNNAFEFDQFFFHLFLFFLERKTLSQ